MTAPDEAAEIVRELATHDPVRWGVCSLCHVHELVSVLEGVRTARLEHSPWCPYRCAVEWKKKQGG